MNLLSLVLNSDYYVPSINDLFDPELVHVHLCFFMIFGFFVMIDFLRVKGRFEKFVDALNKLENRVTALETIIDERCPMPSGKMNGK